eukprot:gene22919-31223_t
MVSNGGTVSNIIDGDIPCTPEKEPSFGYAWNFCEDIPVDLAPVQCTGLGKKGVVLQYAQYGPDSIYCYILGHSLGGSISYSLLDTKDPSKGVSISYPSGEQCNPSAEKGDPTAGIKRSVTIDVQCANTKSRTVSAQEPDKCAYKIAMKSFYGCPTECPITSNGLCDSHGFCGFDSNKQKSYCYCNAGFYGSACESTSAPVSASTTYDGFSVQIGLLSALLAIALLLTGGLFYMGKQIGEFRKDQVNSHYKHLPGGESEMVDTVVFR